MNGRYGFLAIWCDMAAEDLADYRNWLTQEHIADRTFLPGFLGVRLFEGLDDPRSHFILYATRGAEVLRGPEYRAVLDTPSAWTRAIMPRFGPFDRALGEQVLKVGNGFGSHVAIWRLRLADPAIDLDALRAGLAGLAGRDGVVSLRLFSVDPDVTGRQSEEKTMRRSVEGDFHYLLCAETTGDAPVRHAEAAIGALLSRLFPTLDRADSSCRRMIYGEAPHEGPTDRTDEDRREKGAGRPNRPD